MLCVALTIAEHVVGLGALGELVGGDAIAGILDRVEVERELAVGLLDVGILGRACYLQYAVVVFAHLVTLRCSCSLSLSLFDLTS